MPSYDEHLDRQRARAQEYCSECQEYHEGECKVERDWMQEAKDNRRGL